MKREKSLRLYSLFSAANLDLRIGNPFASVMISVNLLYVAEDPY